MQTLSNKIAIITGASSGIGRAAALLFAAEGAKLVVTGRRQGELDKLVAEIGPQAVALVGDVADEAHAKAAVDLAVSSFGGLDIAFNNAGILGQLGPAPEMSLATWQEVMNTNLTGCFLGAKYQIPAMLSRGGGSLIFTASFVGHTAGMPGMSAYGAAKAGVIGFAKCLAAEYGRQGLRVNALLPGGTDTPISITRGAPPEVQEFVNGLHALKRMAEPEEIAKAALFLASDASSFVTGSALLADGGVSISRG